MGTDDVLTFTEAATALGCSRSHIRNLVAAGILPGFRSEIDRRARFIRAEDLERLKARALVSLNSGEERQRVAGVAA